MAPNDPQKAAFLAVCNDLRGRMAGWATLNGSELASLNALLSRNNLQPVAAANVSELQMPVCVGARR